METMYPDQAMMAGENSPVGERPIALRAVDLVKDYGKGENLVHALRDVSVSFERGAVDGISPSCKNLNHNFACSFSFCAVSSNIAAIFS